MFIQLEKISKSFRNSKTDHLQVLEDISLSVEKGSIVGILGKSGCGKSTLLKIIAGLIPYDSGEYKINNQSVNSFLENKNLGFVFQKPTLFPWKNLYSNLMFPMEILKKKISSEDKIRAEKLLEKFKIADFKDYYPKQLSGGMLQRASVARTFMFEPEILLLDEPFNAIDEQTREELWVDFRNFWKSEKTTVILVTHSIREVVYFSDIVHIISQKPARLIDSVKIDLPDNRTQELILSSKFTEIESMIRNING
jgi:NitT/TauT family transport system ATP-binding protein